MSSLHFFVEPVISNEVFINRLKDIGKAVCSNGFTVSEPFPFLGGAKILDIAFAPRHIALLLEGGRVCRVGFSVSQEYAESIVQSQDKHAPSNESQKQSESSGDGQPPSKRMASGNNNSSSQEGGLSTGRQRLHGSSVSAASVSRLASAISGSGGSSSRSRAMAAGLVALGSRGLPPLPASMVPEALVQQVQTVLSGSKSRQLIIRELQRTHLDVNLAVNNLLSRDSDGEGDDDDDDMGDSSTDPAEVVRILDAAAASASGLVEHLLMDDDEDVQFVSRAHEHVRRAAAAFFDSGTSEDNYNPVSHSSYHGSSKASSAPSMDAVSFDKELSYWVQEDGTPILFTSIGAMQSELVAVDTHGHLQAWPWREAKPPPYSTENHGHPRVRSLALSSTDRITLLACASSRASLMTDSFKIATWIDSSIRHSQTGVLEHPATLFPQLQSLQIQKLNVSDTHTAVLTSAGSIYWWGALPYRMRCARPQMPPVASSSTSNLRSSSSNVPNRSTWEAENTATSSGASSGLGLTTEAAKANIIPGATVRLRTSPLVSCGALALGLPSSGLPGVETCPRLAELLEDAWNPTSSYRFKLMPLTATAHASVTASTIAKRKRSSGVHQSSDANATVQSHHPDEVNWPLADVVLLNDGPSPPLGRVVKVDGEYAAVRFNGSSSGSSNSSPATQSDIETLLADCRLLRLSELEVVGPALSASNKRKTSASSVSSVQLSPRRLDGLAEPGTILGWLITADSPGPALHILTRRSDGLYYRTVPFSVDRFFLKKSSRKYSRTSSRQQALGTSGQLVRVPMSQCWLNDNATYRLIAPSPANSSVLFAIDKNCSVFPLCRPPVASANPPSFCEPPFLRLGPMTAFVGGLTPNPRSTSSSLSQSPAPFFLGIASFHLPLLTTCIQRRDVAGVKRILQYFERMDAANELTTLLESELSDGERNILHVAVEACAPLVASGTFGSNSNTTGTRRASFDDSSDFDIPPFADSGASSRHRLSARRLTLRQMIREASSAASIPAPGGSNSSNNRGSSSTGNNNNGSGSSSGANGDGNNNPATCSTVAITSSAADDNSSGNGGSMTDTLSDLINSLVNPYSYVPPSSSSTSSGGGGNSGNSEDLRRVSMHSASETILTELLRSKAIAPHLTRLLTAVDCNTRTPLMAAVVCRAYSAAIQVLRAVLNVVADSSVKEEKQQQQQSSGSAPSTVPAFKLLEPFVFPTRHANPDDNPFHMLCFSDTCSFTWTGAEHINQDIYECRSCGLVGPLCCCSECARVCHRGPGHDCRLKRTSPTAYCDCWEKCSCRGLLAGNQSDRIALAKELTKVAPQLVMFPTAASLGRQPESILSFLLRTLQRQQLEQQQYRGPPNRSSGMRSRAGTSSGYRSHGSQQPEAVDPPRFVRQVLTFILDDPALLSNIFNCLGDNAASPFGNRHFASHQCELDHVAFLILRCSSDVHDRFSRAILEMDQRGSSEAVGAFVRSVVRAYTAIAASLPPNLALLSRGSSSSCGCIAALPLRGCRQLLSAVPLVAIRELASAASAVIRPVTLGMCRGPSSACNFISRMMVTSSVPEAVDAAEAMLIGVPGSTGQNEYVRSSHGGSRHDHPIPVGASRFTPGLFSIRRAGEPAPGDDGEDTLDDDLEADEASSSDGDDNRTSSLPGSSNRRQGAEFLALQAQELSMEGVTSADDDNSQRQASGARSPSSLIVENYVDAEEYPGVVEEAGSLSNNEQPPAAASVPGQIGEFMAAPQSVVDLPPPLLPSVGPSSSASSVSGAPSSVVAAPSAAFAFAEPFSTAAQQDNADADETISLIRSAAATAGSEAGGTSLISYVSEEEEDLETVSAAGSSVAQHDNQSAGGVARNPNQQSSSSSRFRLRLQPSSSSSSSSDSDNSDEPDVIRVMVASDMDDALIERDTLGEGHGGSVDDVSNDSNSALLSVITRTAGGSHAQRPPPPPLPPPPPPPAISSYQPSSSSYRSDSDDLMFFSPPQVTQTTIGGSRSSRFVTSNSGPIIDMSEMPMRTASPTVFHQTSSLGSVVPGLGSANNSSNNTGGGGNAGPSGSGPTGGGTHPNASSLLSPQVNEMFQSANQQHLTRLFSILVRFAADLLSSLVNNQNASNTAHSSFLSIRSTSASLQTKVTAAQLRDLQDDVDGILDAALRWIVAAVDSVEAQLRCRHGHSGENVNTGRSYDRHGNSGHFSRDPISSARLFFGHHALCLIRDPHGILPNPDFLPALRHAIDALLALIRACSPRSGEAVLSNIGSSGSSRLVRSGSNRLLGFVEVSDDSDDSLPSSSASHISSPISLIRSSSADAFQRNNNNNATNNSGPLASVTYSAPPHLTTWPSARVEVASATVTSPSTIEATHSFFLRSSSLTAVGWEAPPTFSTPAEEALPLALRPDLLNPLSRRHELFGLRRQSGLATSGLLSEFPADPFANAAPPPPPVGNDTLTASEHITENADSSLGRSLRRPYVAGSELTEPLLAARWALVLNRVAAVRPDGQGVDNLPGSEFANLGGPENSLNFSRFSPLFGVDAIAAGFTGIPSWSLNNNSVLLNSPVNELVGGFALVERRFRADMERLRNSQQREIVLADLERSPSSTLLACVTRQLQIAFSRRTGSTSSATTRPYLAHTSSTGYPALLCHKLKVSFQHEPGEGAGVARSLFTTFAEMIVSEECTVPVSQLRTLIGGEHSQRSSSMSSAMQPSTSASSSGAALSGLMPPNAHGHSSSSQSRAPNLFSQLIPAFFSAPISRGGSSSSSTRDWDRILRDAVAVSMLGAQRPSNLTSSSNEASSPSVEQQNLTGITIPEFAPNHPEMQARFPSHKLRFGVRLLSRISTIEPRMAGRIVYVLLHLTPNQLLQLLTSENRLRDVVANTAMLINETQAATLLSPTDTAAGRSQPDSAVAPGADPDTAPLFYRLSNGHYAPRVGRASMERLIALRCVGRVIGLSLLHAELFPLLLARHVIKYIIGQTPFCFHDLAFLDPVAFDSLRRIAHDVTTLPQKEAQKLFEAIDLTAVVDLLPEEGGGRVELNLQGTPAPATGTGTGDAASANPVTPDNALAFVLAYAELRLVHAARPALDALRAGVLDVISASALDSLTPEDATLLLCGTGTRIAAEPASQQRVVDRLRVLTTIQNESGRDADMVRRFKGWFWAEVSRLAKQCCTPATASTSADAVTSSNNNSNALSDLLSFWTGSSALPATDAVLISTPPSLVVRPPDDIHLPTANTCISRLYVPLYSSRLVLRRKLAIAIRTKMFGFV